MTTFRKSVPAPVKAGAGAPTPKKGEVTVIYADDVLTFPERDANGVKMIGNIVLVPGAVMHTLYETPSSQKASYSVDGDEDMEGFLPKFEGTHPGDSIEVNEFVQNALGEGFIIIYGLGCGTNQGKVLGSPCNPMKLKPEFIDDKEGTKTTLVFEQTVKSGEIPGFYYGEVTYATYPTVASPALDLLKATGAVYKLPSDAADTAISIASIDLDAGTIVTLIGGGGTGPSTLANGASTAATVVLNDGITWTALEDATISLKVVDDGTTVFLIEEMRTA